MIDLNELEKALSKMKPRQKMYELVKKEMQKRDRWKASPRGNPMKSDDDRRKGLGSRN